MPWIQFVLSIDVFESLEIQMQHKWPRLEVMTPMSQGSYYNIKLFIIGAIVVFRAIKLFIEICKRSLGLD